ncbi:haloacid dehalogenase type II [Methylocapsa aurea]|uniref:haloacid dehalogenase type II n=1 Tax=Methylocapsa aurea TaxID=663610 RepID=UPI000691E6F3
MTLDRRRLLGSAAAAAAAGLISTPAAVGTAARFDAVAFDGFPIFDPRSVAALCEVLFPGRGEALSEAWRTRQFEYAWLSSLAGRYRDFWEVTGLSLDVAASTLKLHMTIEQRERLMTAYLSLPLWPDAAPALTALKAAGIRLAFLSNLSPLMLAENIAAANLGWIFDHVLSTDAVKSYKPDPKAYQLGIDALGARRERILFVASAGWDAYGAKAFGYPTLWVNRSGQPSETLGAPADAIVANMNGLAGFVGLPDNASSASRSK